MSREIHPGRFDVRTSDRLDAHPRSLSDGHQTGRDPLRQRLADPRYGYRRRNGGHQILLQGKSYCKANLRKQACGAALDIKLHPSAVSGENGIAALVAMQKTFVQLGGFFMQTDVIDAEVLKDAREHPEQYKTLSVRVSGWNARFITLNKEWQDMIIERTSGGTV